MSVRLVTLGAPSCYAGDVELAELPAQKARFALLVYLAVERNVSRDEVTALFWPDRDDDHARHALSQSLYELKRLLSDLWVRSQSGRLLVSDDVVIDAREFTTLFDEEAYERAVNLYRGPFLSGFFLSNCKGFETWVDRQRAQLERTHRRARRECVNQLVEAKRLQAAVDVARRWVELDQFEDEANHRLIELLALAGHRTEALREYSAYELRLREELAIEPLDNTKQLVEAIRGEIPAVNHTPQRTADLPIAAASGQQLTSAEQISSRSVEAPGLIKELLRRRVLRMSVWYGATSFAVVQFAQTMQEAFHLPPMVLTTAAVLAIAGFPLAVLLSWHFDLTSEGLERTRGTKIMSPASAAVLIGVCVLGGVLWLSGFKREAHLSREEQLDSTTVAILPFAYHRNVPVQLHEDQLLQDALLRWNGVRPVDLFQVRDALAREDTALSSQDALRVAKQVGAGRYIRGEISRFGDSLRVHGVLYDASRGGTPVFDRTVKIGLSLIRADSAFAELADALLFQGEVPPPRADAGGTRSLPALRAFGRGNAAILDWDLQAADSSFEQARGFDADYSQAELWLAQVRSWSRSDPVSWKNIVAHVLTEPERLSSRDRLLAQALLALANGQTEHACELYHDLTRREPRDFVGWYSYANCQGLDAAVLPDGSSPSGWRFRSSYHSAVRAYRRAFEILPSIHKAFSDNAYSRVRTQLLTSSGALRKGRALAPDTMQFYAAPSWQGDSLALVPYPARDFVLAQPWTVPATVQEAVERQREIFRDVAVNWASSFPASAHALEAVAVSLELLASRSAIDTLRRARSIAKDPAYQLNLAAAEVLLRLKFGIKDPRELTALRLLADSILRHPAADVATPQLMASVAALTGRAFLAARLIRDIEITQGPHAVEATPSSAPLLVFSAFGGPTDSIRKLQRAVRTEMAPQQRVTDYGWYTQAAVIALPVYRFEDFAAIRPGHYLLEIAATFATGDTARASLLLENVRRARRLIPPSDVSIDALYVEATILSRMGKSRMAIEWLDPFFTALRSTPPQQLGRPEYTAALVRTMVLRADLARATGDHVSARRWALAITTLWRNADPFLQDIVQQMSRTAETRS